MFKKQRTICWSSSQEDCRTTRKPSTRVVMEAHNLTLNRNRNMDEYGHFLGFERNVVVQLWPFPSVASSSSLITSSNFNPSSADLRSFRLPGMAWLCQCVSDQTCQFSGNFCKGTLLSEHGQQVLFLLGMDLVHIDENSLALKQLMSELLDPLHLRNSFCC